MHSCCVTYDVSSLLIVRAASGSLVVAEAGSWKLETTCDVRSCPVPAVRTQ